MIRHVTFTCPQTGARVAAFMTGISDQETNDPYRSVQCPACGSFHSVAPNGHVLGEPENTQE